MAGSTTKPTSKSAAAKSVSRFLCESLPGTRLRILIDPHVITPELSAFVRIKSFAPYFQVRCVAIICSTYKVPLLADRAAMWPPASYSVICLSY